MKIRSTMILNTPYRTADVTPPQPPSQPAVDTFTQAMAVLGLAFGLSYVLSQTFECDGEIAFVDASAEEPATMWMLATVPQGPMCIIWCRGLDCVPEYYAPPLAPLPAPTMLLMQPFRRQLTLFPSWP